MIPVAISEKESELLKKAKELMDWRVFSEVKQDKLSRNKLFYLYQRFIALPANRMDQVKDIAEVSRRMREAEDDGSSVFKPVTIRTYSKKDKSNLTEIWYEQGGKKITVQFKQVKNEDDK